LTIYASIKKQNKTCILVKFPVKNNTVAQVFIYSSWWPF